MGGQDNIQSVAGQMLGFFGELGFVFPQFPYVAYSRGWTHEDMENNVKIVSHSEELTKAAGELATRCLDTARQLLAAEMPPGSIHRAGRKAHRLIGEG